MNKSKTISNSEFFNNLTQIFEGLNKIGNVLFSSNKLIQSSYLGQILQPSGDFKKICSSMAEILEKMKELGENLEYPLAKFRKLRENLARFTESQRKLAGNLGYSLAMSNAIDNNIIDQQFFQYDNPTKANIKPEFSDRFPRASTGYSVLRPHRINFMATEMIDKVSIYVVKYIPDFENRIELALENLNSNQPEKLSSATLILRRILADLAKKIEPTNNSEKYYKILADYIKGEHRQVCEVHLNFIVDEANRGVHKPITQNQAIKLFFHFVLFLDEINWDDINKTYLK